MIPSFFRVTTSRPGAPLLRAMRLKQRLAPHPVDAINLSRVKSSAYSEAEIKNKVIFVHIPKTAGNSVAQALFGIQNSGHAVLMKYYVENPALYEACYKFAFVRNPWDRFVSAFTYLSKGGGNSRDAEIAKALIGDLSFEAFVERCGRSWTFRKRVLSHVHFVPQSDFLKGPGGVDDIFRFENIDADFAQLAARFGLPAQLEKINASARGDYRAHFRTVQHIETIARLYAEDVSAFDYRFAMPRQTL